MAYLEQFSGFGPDFGQCLRRRKGKNGRIPAMSLAVHPPAVFENSVVDHL
jgi:hypothetical protein